MNNLKNAILGIFVILIGLILATNALELTNIDIFFEGWWTLFIIVPSIIGLVKEENKLGSIIWLGIGVTALLFARGIISFSMISKLTLPVFIILVGLGILSNSFKSNNVAEKMKEVKGESLKETDIAAIFSGQKINFAGQEFRGIELNAIFGGIELDLREANIKKDQVIEATAIFGRIDIMVPQNVNVVVKPIGIFGGTSNSTRKSKDNKVTIYVTSTAIFGGVEIK